MIPDSDFHFTQEDFRAIADLLRADAGIALPEGKATLVYARLAKRLRSLGLRNFAQYTALLTGPAGDEERRHMVTALTTNVTRFFREPHHFDHLRSTVLPGLIQAAQNGARVRLWSAACSTGQEPYSLAAVVADLVSNVSGLNLRILATDIDPVVLEHARVGRFDSVDGIPPSLLRWFNQSGGSWTVAPVLKQLVTFRPLNLVGTWPFRGPFDAVMCRNVAIYFDASVQSKLWDAFSGVIRPGGMLYIGHSERISGPAARCFENIGITTYQRRESMK